MLFWVADGGGTKTDGVLADATGRVLARAVGGPCNLTTLGGIACASNLDSLLTSLCATAGVQRQSISHAFLALGGLDTEADRQQFTAIIDPLLRGCTTRWQVENDVLAALFSGTWGKPGIVLLAGTGSMGMALDIRGRLMRSGGWGYMIGRDPGSAFYVGQIFLAHVLREYDMGHAPSELTRLAMKQAGVGEPPGLMDWIESTVSPASSVAQFAKIVDSAAVNGDAFACQVLIDAATAMVDHFTILRPRLDFAGLAQVPVVLAGSMFKSAIYRQRVQELITAVGDQWQAVMPGVPPVGGSYVGALQLAGCNVTADIMMRFERELRNWPQ